MSERLAPVDEYGMPYAIIPAESPSYNADTTRTEHHAFYRSRATPLTTAAGRALRLSRVHMIERWQHDIWHARYLNGVKKLPQTETEAFGLLVLSCAGYLSREGMELQANNSFKRVRMNPNLYQHLRSKQEMHPQTESNSRIPEGGPHPRRVQDYAVQEISAFLTNYAKRQNIEHLKNEDFVDEFLTTRDTNRRYELGRLILTEAMRVAVEPVTPIYRQALDDGLLRVAEPDPIAVATRYPFRGPWEEHIQDLELRLAA